MTTKDIIKLLPIEKNFKEELLAKFDTLNPDQKFAVERIVWQTYDEVCDGRINENLILALMKAGKNEEIFDENFYKRVVDKTNKEIDEEATKTITQFDLSHTRQGLAEMVGQATKQNSIKTSKPPTIV